MDRKRIFISYRHTDPDQVLAKTLYSAFATEYNVFMDTDIPVGVDWAARIRHEIDQADFFICLLSKDAVQSEMVIEEINIAHQLQKERGTPILFPVRVAFREPLGYMLGAYLNRIQWAMWDGDDSTDDLMRVLRQAIFAKSGLPASIFKLELPTVVSIPVPLPAADLETPNGTMNPDSIFYVERESDRVALALSAQSAAFTITIKGPRQMGKSSLLIRLLHQARDVGRKVAFIDFQLFDKQTLGNADEFFYQFAMLLTDSLGLDDQIDDHWKPKMSNTQRCTRYIQRYILEQVGSPIVLAMDEVDSLYQAPFRSDFYGMLRSWHNMRANENIWKKMSVAFVTSTEPLQLIDNLNISPFNVSTEIELRDFELRDLHSLNHLHGSQLTDVQIDQLNELLGGHPFLTRRALYLLATDQINFAELLRTSVLPRGPFGDHLRHHLLRLQERPELVTGFQSVLRVEKCDERIFFRLKSAGLVEMTQGRVVPRNRLYADYFRENL